MRSNFCCYLVFFLLLVRINTSVAQSSPKLHLLSVVETSNATRPDRARDAERIHEISGLVANHLHCSQLVYNFEDSIDFTLPTLRLTLKQLRVKSQDIIWFHFSGYGYNNGDSPWPLLRLNGGEVPLVEIIRILRDKSPQTLIITVECGGKIQKSVLISNQADSTQITAEEHTPIRKPRQILPKSVSEPISGVVHFSITKNYQRLFYLDGSQQMVLMSSCSPGENSFSDSSQGSVWLQALQKTLNQSVDNVDQPADWSKVKEKLIRSVQEKTSRRQTPQLKWDITTGKTILDEK